MTPDEISALARAAAREAVGELLLALGVDSSQPHQVLEMQRDFAYVRSWRQSIELVRNKSLATAVLIVVTGFMGLIWLTLKGSH
jgi:hypothetical protein